MSTRKGDELLATGRTSAWDSPGALDNYITGLCLERTIGSICSMREHSRNVRAFFGCSLIANAVLDQDMSLIEQIANRIDGTIPDLKERSSYANIMGNAIDDVLDMTTIEQATIHEDDTAVIALAKTVVYIATSDVGNNPAKRKERQKAVEMVTNRTGGRRTEPVRDVINLEYVEPDWMSPLPEGSVADDVNI